jgi:hypothetical protein
MQLKTLLNRVHPLKSFVYTKARFVDADQALAIEVVIEPREQPPRLLGLRPKASRIRPSAHTEAVPVRPPLGHRRLLPLHHA